MNVPVTTTEPPPVDVQLTELSNAFTNVRLLNINCSHRHKMTVVP